MSASSGSGSSPTKSRSGYSPGGSCPAPSLSRPRNPCRWHSGQGSRLADWLARRTTATIHDILVGGAGHSDGRPCGGRIDLHGRLASLSPPAAGTLRRVTPCCVPGWTRVLVGRDRLPAGRGSGSVAERPYGTAHPAAHRGSGVAPARRSALAAAARSSRCMAPLAGGSAAALALAASCGPLAGASARRAGPQLHHLLELAPADCVSARPSGAGDSPGRACFVSRRGTAVLVSRGAALARPAPLAERRDDPVPAGCRRAEHGARGGADLLRPRALPVLPIPRSGNRSCRAR